MRSRTLWNIVISLGVAWNVGTALAQGTCPGNADVKLDIALGNTANQSVNFTYQGLSYTIAPKEMKYFEFTARGDSCTGPVFPIVSFAQKSYSLSNVRSGDVFYNFTVRGSGLDLAFIKSAVSQRLAAVNFPNYFVRNLNGRVRIDQRIDQKSYLDSKLYFQRGLGDSNCLSFESFTLPGYFLRQRNLQVVVERDDGSAAFRNDATFCLRAGRVPNGYSFESFSNPGYFVRHQNSWLSITAESDNLALTDSTFTIQL